MERTEYDIINPRTGIINTVKMTIEEATRCTNDVEFAQQIIARQAMEESLMLASTADDSITSEAVQETEHTESNTTYRWRENNIYLLLDVYEELQEKFSNPKISQKRAWVMVAEEINKKNPSIKVTGPQCMAKMRAIKKIYKNVKDHNSKSGNDRRTWKYFDRCNEIFGTRAWATPQSLVSSEPEINESAESAASTYNNSNDQPESPPSAPTQRRENRSIVRMLELKMEQRERHEAARQRRHEERLANDQALIQTLKDFMASGI